MLGVLLVVPVLAFLFLEIFGSNYYELKRYYPAINPDTEEPLVRNGDTVFQRIPDFRLTSQQGETITLEHLQGKAFVANFIFTSCQGVCKKMSSQMSRVQQAFEKEPKVKILSFTVDPARDSVAALQAYAARYLPASHRGLQAARPGGTFRAAGFYSQREICIGGCPPARPRHLRRYQ